MEIKTTYSIKEDSIYIVPKLKDLDRWVRVDDLINYLEKFVKEYPSQQYLVKTLLNELKKE